MSHTRGHSSLTDHELTFVLFGIHVDRKQYLLLIVDATDSAFSGFAEGGKQQAGQYRDNRNHDQKLNQGKKSLHFIAPFLYFLNP